MSAPRIRIKRVYDAPAAEDGRRILVDRLWPRGLTKAAAAIDFWLKDAAPSPGLRAWFGHDPARWLEFRRRYRAELRANPAAVDRLREISAGRHATLVYAARDLDHNHALVLAEYLGEE